MAYEQTSFVPEIGDKVIDYLGKERHITSILPDEHTGICLDNDEFVTIGWYEWNIELEAWEAC